MAINLEDKEVIYTDVCVIGAGAAGLSTASAAVQMGVRVVLVEKHLMGGDCLNYGCVPTKSLLSIARLISLIRQAKKIGIEIDNYSVDYMRVYDHIQDTVAKIAPKDSKEQYEELGVNVIKGEAKFLNDKTVGVEDKVIHAKWFVIATGAGPAVPPINGVENVDFLTNRTLFGLKALPEHLMILGAGPIGCETAQAYCLLGTRVSIIQRGNILKNNEPENVDIMRKKFIDLGINIYEQTKIIGMNQESGQITVTFEYQGREEKLTGSHLLLAVGRKPVTEELDLAAAGVKYTAKGIIVDDYLRTSNKRIFAAGDSCAFYKFTHVATYHASVVIRNMLLRLPTKVSYKSLPWAIYTEPEIAHVGLSEAEARSKFRDIQIVMLPFEDNDRAHTENSGEGYIKLIARGGGKIVGVSIIGHSASELISLWTLAIRQKIKLSKIASLMMPYPTRSELSKHAAFEYYKDVIYSDWVKKIVQFLMRFN